SAWWDLHVDALSPPPRSPPSPLDTVIPYQGRGLSPPLPTPPPPDPPLPPTGPWRGRSPEALFLASGRMNPGRPQLPEPSRPAPPPHTPGRRRGPAPPGRPPPSSSTTPNPASFSPATSDAR